jgi:hypothetical protein
MFVPVLGEGALAGCAICAPHEHASHTRPLSNPPSRSPQRWCSRTKATKALRMPGMGAGDYHSVDALGYDSIDSI